MFSSRKILKPDVPPKRRTFRLRFFHTWIKLPLFPARHLLSIGNSITEQGPTAKLKANRRLSYADAFAAALAQREAAAIVTGDPELRELADVLRVEWIGA